MIAPEQARPAIQMAAEGHDWLLGKVQADVAFERAAAFIL
jgi:hypothetical protein